MKIRIELSKTEIKKLNTMINGISKDLNEVADYPVYNTNNHIFTDDNLIRTSNNKVCKYTGIKNESGKYILDISLKTAFVNTVFGMISMFYKSLAKFILDMKSQVENLCKFFE